MAKTRKVAKRAKPNKSRPKPKPKAKPVRAKKAKHAHVKKAGKRVAKKPAKKIPSKKAPKQVSAPPAMPKPEVPAIEILPPPPPEEIKPAGEGKAGVEEAPPEEKEGAITPEEALPQEKPEELAPPAEEKKEKKKAPGRELTPEEKIDLMFPEEKPEGEEEKPAEKPGKEPEEIPAEEEKPEEKPEEELKEEPELEPEEKPEEVPAEEKPEAPMEEEKPEKKKVSPPLKPAEEKAAPAAAMPPFAMLPAWEDRRRLRKVIEEEGFEFSTPAPGSRELREALKLLAKYKQADTGGPGYLLVCVRDRGGKLVGATDGYVAAQVDASVLVIGRSVVFAQDKRKDLHMIMHGALLEAAKPTHVACCTGRPNLSKAEDVGKLIFFGRGLGMSAIPVNHPRLLCFVRCVGKEHNPRISGADAAMVLAAINKIQDDDALGSVGAELSGREAVTLVMLPASPDSGEHMHELKDAVLALGLPTNQFDSAFDALESQYLRGRADITPASLF